MPIYEYKCLNCNHQFEQLQRIVDASVKVCPTCQGQVQKVMSSTSFVLKGGGWYATEYGKNRDNREVKEVKP